MRNPNSFLLRNTRGDNLALGEVVLKHQEGLKAEKQKIEMCNARVVQLHHNEHIICTLEMRDPFRNEVRKYQRYVTSSNNLGEYAGKSFSGKIEQ